MEKTHALFLALNMILFKLCPFDIGVNSCLSKDPEQLTEMRVDRRLFCSLSFLEDFV